VQADEDSDANCNARILSFVHRRTQKFTTATTTARGNASGGAIDSGAMLTTAVKPDASW
jgi:hypothetical protein